jgi:hypothetical protein
VVAVVALIAVVALVALIAVVALVALIAVAALVVWIVLLKPRLGLNTGTGAARAVACECRHSS